MRKAKAKWLSVLVLLATIIVGISGFVKVRGPTSVVEPTSVEQSAT